MAIQEITPDQLNNLDNIGLETGPVNTLSMLRYRPRALYSEEEDEIPCSGLEAYGRFLAMIYPMIQELGVELVFRGEVMQTFFAPTDDKWDDIFILTWPSIAEIKTFYTHEDFKSAAFHRSAALQDARVIICHRVMGELYTQHP